MYHTPVLLNETIENLNIKKNGIYVDCTLGGGGHSKEILKRLNSDGLLIGIDQDIDAINEATENLKEFKNKIIVKDNFCNLDKILNKYNIKKVDGICLDLGVSGYQFDNGNRGFSYNKNAKLDMRMDMQNGFSCYDVINSLSEKELTNIISEYGEEKFAKNIAHNIVNMRSNKKIETTFELVEIVEHSIHGKFKFKDKHPAKRTFQAFRIYVNDEINVLKKMLDYVVYLLNNNGRLAIITFHSIEDRIVKQKFNEFYNPCTCPKGYPCVCGKKSLGNIINKKVIVATDDELLNNHRSKSAKLRVFERKEYE